MKKTVLISILCIFIFGCKEDFVECGQITAEETSLPYNGETTVRWEVHSIRFEIFKQGEKKRTQIQGITSVGNISTGILKENTKYIIVFGKNCDSTSVVIFVGEPKPAKITTTSNSLEGKKSQKISFGWVSEGDDISTTLNGKLVPNSFQNFEHYIQKDTVFTIKAIGPKSQDKKQIKITCKSE